MDVRANPRQRALAAYVARRFYLDHRNKSQIAEELRLSRFKVARLLEEAERSGIVRIEVVCPADLDVEAAAAIEQHFGLRDALVLTQPSSSGDDPPGPLGELTAAYLGELLSDGDVLGVSWGRVLEATAEAMRELASVTAIQLVGGVTTSDGAHSSSGAVQRLGRLGSVSVLPLHAPLLVDDERIAGSVRRTSPVADTLRWFDEVTVAVLGIGSWDPASSSLRDALPHAARRQFVAAGAVCDLGACVFDGDGDEISLPVTRRMIAMTAAQLRAVPRVVGVAAGREKTGAIRSALRTGIIDTFITDLPTATRLLAQERTRGPSDQTG